MKVVYINKDLVLSNNVFLKKEFVRQSTNFKHINTSAWSPKRIAILKPDHIHFSSAAQPVEKWIKIEKIMELRKLLPGCVITHFYADALKSSDYRKKLIQLMDKSFYSYDYPGAEWMPVPTAIDFWNRERQTGRYGIIFVGNVYEKHLQKYKIKYDRQLYLKEVLRHHRVTVVGNKWDKYYGIPQKKRTVNYEQTRDYYLNSTVGLNLIVSGLWNLSRCWSARLTHMMLVGLPCFTPRVKGIDSVFTTGEEVILYDSIDDLIMKMDYFMKRSKLLEHIGIKGRIKMMSLADVRLAVMKILDTRRDYDKR